MKRFLSLTVVALAFVGFAMVGCGKKEEEKKAGDDKGTTTTPAAATTK